MKKKLGQTIAKTMGMIFAAAFMMTVMYMDAAAAGSVTVTPDKSSVAMGETVNVTVQTSEPTDPATIPEVSVTYDADILTFTGCNVECGGGGGLLTFMGSSATVSFTAAKTGNVNINAEAVIDDDGANPAMASAIVTVGASAQGDLSSDATLHVLEMNPGTMEPEFSPQVTEYKIFIGNDVKDITVSGAVSDPTAQITAASGFKDLKEGTNQAVITVTAADGTTLTYHFTIEREGGAAEEDTQEEEPVQETESVQTSEGLQVTIDGMQYTIQSVISEDMLPDGCVKTSSVFNGQNVEAALFEKGGMTLLYGLTADGASGEYFIYNEGTGKLQFFVQLRSIENRFIVPIAAQENPPKQFKAEQMQWNNSYVPAFVLDDRSVDHAEVFYLLYAISNEGEKGFYLYDTMEGTYQRFLDYSGTETAVVNESGGMSKAAMIVIAVLGFLLIIAIVIIVNLIISNKEMQDEELPRRTAKSKKKTMPKERRPVQEEKKSMPKEKTVSEKKVVVPQQEPAAVKKQEEEKISEKAPEKVQERPVIKRTVMPQFENQPVVSMTPSQVPGTVSVTGNIPIKVVPTPKNEAKRPSVPIFTLERQPVQLTREAPADQLDDDFEFEFINIDNE